MKLPTDRKFTPEHEWALKDGDRITIGITDYAQKELGDVVFVDLPQVGSQVSRGAVFGTVESVKTVSELYAPVSGTVVEVHGELRDSPASVNEDPYGAGWMIVIKPSSEDDFDTLLSPERYQALIGE
jgi:glycine cleavage system H protein